jgi:hypothetical protein
MDYQKFLSLGVVLKIRSDQEGIRINRFNEEIKKNLIMFSFYKF